MSKKITSKYKYLPEKYALSPISNVDNFVDITPHFYNSRLLNQFKRLLKAKGIDYIYRKNGGFLTDGNVLIVDRFHLVLITTNDGRFTAYNKCCTLRLTFSFEAHSTIELLAKLLKFRIIGIGTVKLIGDIK